MTERVESLRTLLSGAKLVLYDFDGPLCDVFAGYPASTIARELEELAGEKFRTDDPLEVLRYVAQQKSKSSNAVEDALVAAEISAVKRSSPNAEGIRSLHACLESGLQVGVVSNNSPDAVGVFLEMHQLAARVRPAVGRAYRHPELMKPNEWPLRRALTEADCTSGAAIFVGDSASDIQAAQAASVRCVAYANKPGKRQLFESMSALTIDHMSELSEAVADR